MRIIRFPTAIGAAVAGALLLGCGTPQATTVTVTTQGFQFAPPAVEVQAGQPVRLVLRNPDATEHDFQVDKLPHKASGSGGHAHGTPSTGDPLPPDTLHVHAPPFKEGSVSFTPTAPGTYDVYCAIPGHKQLGMVGKLIVK